MAKHYEFSMNAQPAEFKDGFVSITQGISTRVNSVNSEFTGTLSEALKALAEFSASVKMPHVAFLRMKYRNDRKPAGFDKACTRIEAKGF